VKLYLVPKARALLGRYIPTQLTILEPVHARVKRILGTEIAARPAIDFEGVFFCIAVKEGSSEIIHLDFNDPLPLVTLIWVVSPADASWTGGEFCAPQLGWKVPFCPGQMIAVRARLLAHCGAQVTGGGRLVLTCFSDSMTLEHALFGSPENPLGVDVLVI
ncbi:hypothetical protein FB451DRAFT_747434, partial [Mycena latifolia]